MMSFFSNDCQSRGLKMAQIRTFDNLIAIRPLLPILLGALGIVVLVAGLVCLRKGHGSGLAPARGALPLAGCSSEELAAARVGDVRVAVFSNGPALELCGIPAGEFTMGSPQGEAFREAGEKQHEVVLTKAFWLGRTELTQEQWETVMGNTPSKFAGKDLPVENVSWDEAVTFCGRLNEMRLLPAGWQWGLPTEAQWEHACRAGTTGPFAGNLDEMAWHVRGDAPENKRRPHRVGSKKPNSWGLYDMHGNVWEWCADWHDAEYPSGMSTDPTGPATGNKRVTRGGCWMNTEIHGRSARRMGVAPDWHRDAIGFRVAVVPLL